MSVHVDTVDTTVEPTSAPAPQGTGGSPTPAGPEAARAQRDAMDQAAVDRERTRSEGFRD